MTILDRLDSNWSREEREKVNDNWTIIESYLSNLQGQINILTGNVNVQQLIDQLKSLLSQGTIILDELKLALINAEEIIVDARNATNDANDAAQKALNAVNDIQSMLDNFQVRGTYDNDTVYSKNNSVFYEGSSYVYTNNTPNKGNPPPNYPTVANDHWQMTAAKGASGDGAVSKVNGKEPDGAGEVILTASDVGAASAEQLDQMKPKVNNSWQKDVYNEVSVMNIGAISAKKSFIINGSEWRAPANHLEQLNITLPCNIFSGIIKVNYTSTFNTVNAMGGMEVHYSFSKIDNTPHVSTREVMLSASGFSANFYARAMGLSNNSLFIPLVRAPYVTQQAIFVTVELFGHAYIGGVSKNLYEVLQGATMIFEDLGPTVSFFPWTPQTSQIPTYDAIGKWNNVWTRVEPVCRIINSWNEAIHNGYYMTRPQIDTPGISTAAPDDTTWWMGTVTAHDTLYIVQTVKSVSDDREFERQVVGNGGWSTWIETSPRKIFQSVSEGKADNRAALAQKGVQIPQDPTFAQISQGIRDIPAGGKKANGLLTSASTLATFNYKGGGVVSMAYVDLTGLSFTPSIVVLMTSTGNGNMSYSVFTSFSDPTGFISSTKLSLYNSNLFSNSPNHNLSHIAISGGYRFPVTSQSANYTWYAYE